jgi:aminopeptidase-like protein
MKRHQQRQLLNDLFDELFPMMRSIAGPGIEASIDVLSRHMPFEVDGCDTGTTVFDWTVPPEWHFKRARLWAPDGSVVCDTDNLSLHVVNFSEPVDKVMSLEKLERHLFSLPSLPDAVPYVTSYYQRSWGICISERVRSQLQRGNYRVLIEAEFKAGRVPFAECKLMGETSEEILLTSYLCHPSMANNELSGPLVLLGLYQRILDWPKTHYTYRFLLNPETIGAICYLSKKETELREKLKAGLVLTCVGGPKSSLRIKKSRDGTSVIDQIADYLSKIEPHLWRTMEFSPLNGSDERQYCSPGINLPVSQVSRTSYGEYEQYHNSEDDKDFMSIETLMRSVDQVEQLLMLVEAAEFPVNTQSKCEPQLGKRGLYPNINSYSSWTASSDQALDSRTTLNRILMVLNYSDGRHTIEDLARRCDCTVDDLMPVIAKLKKESLLKETGSRLV